MHLSACSNSNQLNDLSYRSVCVDAYQRLEAGRVCAFPTASVT